MGSWFFLGELLTSLFLAPDAPPPDRCGTCTRCIEACPTAAIIPTGAPEGPEYAIDSRRCIAYFTIELRGPVSEEMRAHLGHHVFGCDICQVSAHFFRNRAAQFNRDRKSTRLNSSHRCISYAVFCLKKKNK